MSDVRLPLGSELEQKASAYRKRMTDAFPRLAPMLRDYERVLDEVKEDEFTRREARTIQALMQQDGALLMRAGTYSTVLGHVNDSIAKQLDVMTNEFITMRKQMHLILEAFTSLEEIDHHNGPDDIALREGTDRIVALVEQTKRIIALSEQKGDPS